MAEFLSAGVFTEELKSGESAILGVSTSNFATVGWLPRGEENKAILCTSLNDYFRKFGTYWKNSDAPNAITAFFKNDGVRAYVVRVTPDDAVKASVSIAGRWEFDAISKGAWGNLVRLVIRGNENHYDFATATFSKFDIDVEEESVDGAGDFSVQETFEAVDLLDEDASDYILTVLNDDQNGSNVVRASKLVSGGIPDAFDAVPVVAESIGTGNGTQVLFSHTYVNVPVAKFSAKIKVNGVVVATDDGRGKWKVVTGTGYSAVSGTVNYETGASAILFTPAPAAAQPIVTDYIQAGVASQNYDLSGGVDGTAVGRSQVTSPVLEADLKGLYAFNLVDEILNIGFVDFPGDKTVQQDLIAYCENRQDCFAILDTKKGIDAQDAKNYKLVELASQSDYAAIYWPQIKIADPLKDGKPKVMSPVGHIAGVYARTDSTRNVGKAPAGVIDGRLNYLLEFEKKTSKGERDLLYPINVNPLIDSTATGRAVWGARTLATTGDFTLINVRRLFIFLRKSTFNSTHDLVFEPIGEELFAIVTLRMTSFLTRLTIEGYFASRVPAQAFRVTCSAANNTPETIAARQLICDVLVAAQTPAEFVRFRFQRSLNTLT